jgi:hypothetical protein
MSEASFKKTKMSEAEASLKMSKEEEATLNTSEQEEITSGQLNTSSEMTPSFEFLPIDIYLHIVKYHKWNAPHYHIIFAAIPDYDAIKIKIRVEELPTAAYQFKFYTWYFIKKRITRRHRPSAPTRTNSSSPTAKSSSPNYAV